MPSKRSFRVLHVSGQDENFKASELNAHSPTTKGWQSSRFCHYPQDIVIQLDKRSRLRKIQILSHQYLIATKIEFYVGDVPKGTTPTLQQARYTRLGYVALSDNEKTSYKARELKSVHVDAVGTFVKFVIHRNHINRHNIYNQVGIVALNVIGDDVSSPDDPTFSDYGDEQTSDDPSAAYNRPDYISPLDDLAFDMYQDPEVAQIIRKLEKKKQEAVLQERYDYAKKLKVSISELQKVGEKLGKYEVEKRQAVENEDYDKAKLKKVQMDEYRLQVYQELEIHDLLESSGSRHPRPIDIEPTRKTTPPPRLEELPSRSSRGPPPPPESAINHSPPPPRTPYEDRPLPAIKNKGATEDEPVQEEPTGQVTGEPESMSEKDQREAASVIDVFGLPLVSKAYSKTWSFKEDALLEVMNTMKDLDPGTSKDEAKTMMRAAIFLVNKGLKDKVFAVFKAALTLLQMILTEYVPNHKIHKSDTGYAVEKTLPTLLIRTGDTAVRTRDQAKGFIVEESSFPEVKPLHVVTVECVRPFKLSMAPRLALSRTELLHQIYKEHGLQNSGLTLENMMKFCTEALRHTAGEVREAAERIIVALYKDRGAPVKNFLPPDDDKTRKNVLYKLLFEAFDKIDGKPSKDELKKKNKEAEAAKQKEIEALQQQLQQLKDMAQGKAPMDANLLKEDQANKANKDKKNKKNEREKKPEPKKEEDDVSTLFQMENTCIFCNDKNESYTEEGLDLHYWKSCPMLKRCSFCKQVVEIAGLTEHFLTECEAKDNFGKCSRCTEAIPSDELDQHVKDKACAPAESGKNHCPLCHGNIRSGEDGWKDHLMGKDGCKQNPRRLPHLNKDKGKAGGKSKPTPSKGAAKGTKR